MFLLLRGWKVPVGMVKVGLEICGFDEETEGEEWAEWRYNQATEVALDDL